MAPYCTNCGSAVADHDRYCSSCGETQNGGGTRRETGGTDSAPAGAPDPQAAGRSGKQRRAIHSGQAPAGDRQAYLATVVGALAVVVLGFGSVLLAPGGEQEIPEHLAWAFLLGFIGYVASIVTMYVDLQSFDEPVWNPRTAIWIVTTIVLYIFVVPYYVYKRRKRLRAT